MAGKKKEKGSPSAIISSAAVAIFCIVAAAADYGAAAVIALIIALVSLGVNIHAFLKKKKAASGSGSPKKKSPQTDYVPLRREEKPAYRTNPYDSEDYTRRRLEQLKRFFDAGLIDKAEYESEKRKIGR